MFLSQFIGKPVLVNGETRGVCLGVGLSLKSYAVKYLFCSRRGAFLEILCREISFLFERRKFGKRWRRERGER